MIKAFSFLRQVQVVYQSVKIFGHSESFLSEPVSSMYYAYMLGQLVLKVMF